MTEYMTLAEYAALDFRAYGTAAGCTHCVVDTSEWGAAYTVYFKSHAAATRYANLLHAAGHGSRYKVFPIEQKQTERPEDRPSRA